MRVKGLFILKRKINKHKQWIFPPKANAELEVMERRTGMGEKERIGFRRQEGGGR